METAHQAGLKITMSMECETDESHETILQTVRGIVLDYPLIDIMELITPEGGGQGKALTPDNVIDYIEEHFGESSLNGVDKAALIRDIPTALSGTLHHLYKAYLVYKKKERVFEGTSPKEIQVGLYVTCNKTLKLVHSIMKNIFPPDMKFSFLPTHGSLAVANNISCMELKGQDLERTMLYSWIEFDGNMYLQQNSCDGIEKLIFDSRGTSADSVYGMCLNHWRTKENELTISYAAYAMVKPTRAVDYYKLFADEMSIKDTASFATLEIKLAQLDTFNRDKLFNIGFCYLGCWLMFKGLKWIREWKSEDLTHSKKEYKEINSLIETALSTAESEEGRFFLRFLINRNTCSICQLELIEELQKIGEYALDESPELLTPQQKASVSKSSEKAMTLARLYASEHMRYLPDRGCEGTLISYCNTIPVYIEHIKQYFTVGESICTHIPETFDQPPSPDKAYL